MERDDLQLQLNELKKHTFYELLNLAGRVYLLVKYSENVQVGTRGFSPEEKEQGLVLVLNTKMRFTWDELGISVKLVFGDTPQKCFIPSDDILAIYSPELNSQLIIGPQQVVEANTTPAKSEEAAGSSSTTKEIEESPFKEDDSQKNKVVRVDFQKKRK
ncbi:MAG: ClpXP protease specificity-enhancing factor SspB [bacterium]